MGGENVKNTMIERVLQIIAPHPCSSCGKVGVILCSHCKYDIEYEPFWGCILCGQPNSNGICNNHDSPLERAYTVGMRKGSLEEAINTLKFHNAKAVARPLAELIATHLPLLPEGTVIVPVPTVRSHVRTRGYDQVELLARHLSEFRNIPIVRALIRRTSTTQHTEDRSTRESQASMAFELTPPKVLPKGPILLVDDIVTTGSTLVAAASLLSKMGAPVWAVTLAYQPLDE